MSTIRIPPALRAVVGAPEVEASGSTVGEALADLAKRYPTVRQQLYDDEGSLQKYVNVYLNQQDVQYLQRLETPAGPGDTIIILPAMAGGM
ncbi:MAG TPA: ubiquitin-like small modifier protein 1 [Chloroflexota bacterium]|nr:ubiquitin-like small modifier protein 1 [Chloroflexota bacterium]